MAGQVTVVNIGTGLRTVLFKAGEGGAYYLKEANVTGWEGGTIMVNNIPENTESGAVQPIKAGDIVSVAPKGMKSGTILRVKVV